MTRLIAALALIAACGDGGPTPVPESVDRDALSPECVEALEASPAFEACLQYCDSCELEVFESCRDRCAMAEVTVDAMRLAEFEACWRLLTQCVISDVAFCGPPERWVDFDRAIEACAGDL